MYFHLSEATKRRFIKELRDFWAYHPRYRDIVDHIQGKYSFRERPQYGIILKTSSANQVQLSADNFLGTLESYVHLAKFENFPGVAVEWVREDARAIQDATRANGGIPTFPSSPGIYFIEVTETAEPVPPYNAEKTFEFYVDPLLDVKDERLLKVDDSTYQAVQAFVEGTTRLYEMPGAIELVRGVNYTEDPPNGRIQLTHPFENPNATISADYRYAAASTGPWRIEENFSNTGAIPGVVLAFGRRVEVGDKMAIVVTSRRQTSAMEYGGRWEINLDFDITARDVYAQQEIADATVMYLWGVARNRLSTEGIEITNVTMGGESEEIYDENGDDYFYNASFSITVMTDWSIHVPLSATIRQVSAQTVAQTNLTAGLTDEELSMLDPNALQNLKVMQSLGIRAIEDPFFFIGKNFEKIR